MKRIPPLVFLAYAVLALPYALATEPQCEVGDPIYRDGVGLGWPSWIPGLPDPATYCEDSEDCWHAGLFWKYDDEGSLTTREETY